MITRFKPDGSPWPRPCKKFDINAPFHLKRGKPGAKQYYLNDIDPATKARMLDEQAQQAAQTTTKVRIRIDISEKHRQYLKVFAASKGTTMNALIERWIDIHCIT